jgi:flagellar basal body P-ring protein FlgI
LAKAAVVLLLVVAMQGCAASPKNAPLTAPADIAVDPSSLQLVGQLSGVWGTKPQRVDGVSLVVGLPGTGSDPPPTAERDVLLSEMQTREVDKPNSVLASSSTALVRVRALIPREQARVTILTSSWRSLVPPIPPALRAAG